MSEWINIKHLIPPQDEDVFAAYCDAEGQSFYFVAFYMGPRRVMASGFWYINDENTALTLPEITHWMPIPPLPEVNDE